MATATTNTYRWVPGVRIKGDAQKVGERLEALHGEHGERLTPRVVVDDARVSDSPLHDCFEWDNVRAGELYREAQARAVIRSIRIETVGAGGTSMRRAFVNIVEQVGEDRQHSYVPVSKVLSSEDMRKQLLSQARSELRAFKKRYLEIVELCDIVDDSLERIQKTFFDGEAA